MELMQPTIVWHHDDSGETQIWFMDREHIVRRGTVLGENGSPALVGPPFRIVGVGDLDGDGKDDIVWHHDDSGETQIWFMDREHIVRRGTVLGENGSPAFVGPPFRIVGAGSGNSFLFHMSDRIHEHYLASGGPHGQLGYPTSVVQFFGSTASRQYRAGTVTAIKDSSHPLGVGIQAIATREARVTFLGFRCLDLSNELSPSDEPYFVISVDDATGVPLVKKFGPFDVKKGTEVGIGEVVSHRGMAPNPLAIRTVGYENDQGDPDETARKLHAVLVQRQPFGGRRIRAGAKKHMQRSA
jgi:hypothetical protein